MKIETALFSGAGNTFHIVKSDHTNMSLEQKKHFSKNICARHAADGLIYLTGDGSEQFTWDFFNNDGSEAEMCGNASRCVGCYIRHFLKDGNDHWRLKTAAGVVSIQALSNEEYQVIMTPLTLLSSVHGFFCNTGVPHLVVELKKFEDFKAKRREAKGLREHKDFSPPGTNVTYISFEENLKLIKAVTYERGVEDFTLACGTGAMAAAFYNLIKNKAVETIVEMPGGKLIMNVADIQRPLMKGPAIHLGNFTYEF